MGEARRLHPRKVVNHYRILDSLNVLPAHGFSERDIVRKPLAREIELAARF